MKSSIFSDEEQNWITLFTTTECNLRCTYCYGLKIENDELDSESAKKIVDWFLDQAYAKEKGISFYGGEPFLKWDLIKKIVNYAKEKCPSMKFSATTNGTLLDKEKVDFINEHFSNLTISIDGDKDTHNLHRKTIDGSGSFDLIDFDLISKIKVDFFINSVVTPKTVMNVYSNAVFFHKKKIKQMITLSPDFDWTDEKITIYLKQFERLSEYYVWCYENNKNPEFVNIFDQLMKVRNSKSKRDYSCGAGRNSFTITPSGDVYPCHRFYTDKIMKLGNIFGEIDLKELEDRNYFKIRDGEKCEKCSVKKFCFPCPYVYEATGIAVESRPICRVYKFMFQLPDKIIKRLKFNIRFRREYLISK